MRQRGDDTWPSLEEPEPTLIAPAPPAPAPPPPDRRIGAGMVLALAALALAVGGIALAYILAHRNTQPAPTTVVVTTSPATGATTAAAARVTVPYLVGLTARKAATRLADLGLEVKAISKPTPSRTGLVVSQRPRAGVQLARRQNVTVVTDRAGSQQVSAPNLVGQPRANARAILQRLGLRTVTTQVSSAEPAGTVVDQAPKPGAKLDRGWEVALSVARQGKTTLGGTTATTAAPTTASSTSTMPNVSHQTEQTAVTAMSRAGILATTR